MVEKIQELLNILTDYIIFIYPGFLSFYIFKYIEGKKVEETSLLVIKSIVLSYIYLIVLSCFIHFDIKDPNSISKIGHIIIFIASIGLPVLLYTVVEAKWFIKLQKKFKITTRRISNPIQLALWNDKNLLACVYMDDYGIMYEGQIRNYVRDTDRLNYLMLSNYKISRINKTSEEYSKYDQTYPVEKSAEDKKIRHNEWVILYFDKISRIEILYNQDH